MQYNLTIGLSDRQQFLSVIEVFAISVVMGFLTFRLALSYFLHFI